MDNTHSIVVTAANFLQAVVEASKSKPVLLDCWAEWCGPCKQLMPVLERLAVDYGGRFLLAKINADEEQALINQLGVRSLPTVVLYKDGKIAEHFSGAIPESQVRQFLDRHLPVLKLSPIDEAHALQLVGDHSGARAIIEAALLSDASSIELQCKLGEILAATDEVDSARAILLRAQGHEPQAPAVKKLAAAVTFADVLAAHPDGDAVQALLASDPHNLDALHASAARKLLAGLYGAALDDWLLMMRRDRKYQDGIAQKSLLMAFDLIGFDDPRVAAARREMAKLLF